MVDLATLENLDGALSVRVFTSIEGAERVYAWFGSSQIHVYDSELCEIDVFTNYDLTEGCCPLDALVARAMRFIEEYEDNCFADADYTDDIFYSHEWDTGEDLERQTNGNAP